MRTAVVVFAAVHRFPLLVGTAVVVAAVSLAISGIPLPQAGADLGQSYTQALTFFLEPLLLAPVYVMILGGMVRLEKGRARSLAVMRIGLVAASTVIAFLALLPTCWLVPTPHAVRVLIENLLGVVGVSTLARCLIGARWAWLPATIMTMIGVMGSENTFTSHLVMINRTPSPVDLSAASAVTAVASILYAIRGASTSD